MENTNGKNNKRKTWWIIAGTVLVIVLLVIFLAPRFLAGNEVNAGTQTGDIVKAINGDLASSATASGQVQAVHTSNLSAQNPGLVQNVYVHAGDTVSEGDLLIQLGTADLAIQVEKAKQNVVLKEADLEALLSDPDEAEVKSGKAAVASAQARRDLLLAGPDEYEIAESEASIRQQQANVASASASYNSVLDSVSGSSLASAEAEMVSAQIAYDQAKENNENFAFSFTHEALVDAQEQLAIAQAKVDELRDGPKQGNITNASSNISAASANLDQAKANHDKLLTGTSSDQIAAAEASVAQAEANLANLLAGPSTEDIAIAEAELENAQLSLADVEEKFKELSILAPFDAVISGVYVVEGEWASGIVAEVMSDDLEIILSVDEIDVGLLSEGQEAIITLETWPEEEIQGDIRSIAPSANDSGDGIVTYDVQIVLADTALPVLVGMTANAELITANRENVLLVPNAAITADRAAGQYFVQKVVRINDGIPVTEKTEVKIGLKDKEFTQIISGLNTDDEVLIGQLEAPTQQFGPPGFGGGDED